MKQIFALLFIFVFVEINAQQYETLGVYLNQSTLQGSARFVGTGGVIGSVGGDISNLSTNPAGLAMFSRTEIQASPTVSINNVRSNYTYFDYPNKITNSEQSKVKFTLGNIGAVFANRRPENYSLRSSNITIGVNRTHDFNRTIPFSAENNFYSYSNYMAATLDNIYQQDPNYITTQQSYNEYPREIAAYLSGLIYLENGHLQDPVNGTVIQHGYKQIKGGVTELSAAWSGSINDVFFIGASLGIPFLNYTTYFDITEEDVGNTNLSQQFLGRWQSYTMQEQDQYTGTGVNLKIGGLVKLGDVVKLSGYMHTPTYYEINNDYNIAVRTTYENSTQDETRALQTYNFSITSPFKVGTGISFLSKRFGFISLEYEADFAKSTKVGFDDGYYSDYVNNYFKNNNKTTHTLRVGGELVIKRFRFRSGLNYRSSPYKKDVIVENASLANTTFTFGAGYRGEAFSFDVAYMRNSFKEYNSFYYTNQDKELGITSWNNKNNIVATFNYRFN